MQREGGRVDDPNKPLTTVNPEESAAFELWQLIKELPIEADTLEALYHAEQCLDCLMRYFGRQDKYINNLET